MVSAVKWEAAPSETTVLTTQLDTLANNTITAASSAYDNRTNLNTYFWIQLNVTFGSSPTDTAPTVDIYIVKSMDGTNYDTSPPTGGADFGETFLVGIPTQKTTSAQQKTVGPFLMPPAGVKFLADNQTGVAFPASGSTIKIFTANLEGQ